MSASYRPEFWGEEKGAADTLVHHEDVRRSYSSER